jgi:cGMP-dependent protein kinase 1
MEYIHGKDLFDVIRESKKVTLEMARYYIGCLILSVEYLHMQNIVYRDLKPENAVVDWKGKLMLVDFGTAVILKPEKFYKTFTIIGTPHYMAP